MLLMLEQDAEKKEQQKQEAEKKEQQKQEAETKEQQKQEARQKSYEEFKNGFLRNVKPVQIAYPCNLCGKPQNTWAFRKRRFKLIRTCHHNIDASYGEKCQPSKQEEKQNIIGRKYVNWDIEYEMTSDYEVSKYESMFHLWNEWDVRAYKTSSARFNWIKQQLTQRKKLEKAIIAFKIIWLRKFCKIENVNEKMLQGGLRRITFYEKCIDYWLKIHRHCNYKDNPLADSDHFGKCYACGMNFFLATQYEKAYVTPYARQVMHLVEDFINGSKFFVCGRCIIKCIGSAGDIYGELQRTSLMYDKEWKKLQQADKAIFMFGHLDHKQFPIHIAWYDIFEEMWQYGKILELVHHRHYVIKVQLIDDNNTIVQIPFGTMNTCQYFIFQRPSTSWSPLYQGRSDDHFYQSQNTILNMTHPQLKTRYITKRNIYSENRETMRNDWVVPIVRKGEQSECVFMAVMHFKELFVYLRNNKLLS